MKPICVFDFNGYSNPGHFPVAMWADWDGEKVVFGGDWSNVAPMICDSEPSEQEVIDWVHDKGNHIKPLIQRLRRRS